MTSNPSKLLFLFGATALVACTPTTSDTPNDPAGDTPNLEVRFQADSLRTGEIVVTKLDVWVAEVVFDADVDEDDISISEPQNRKFDALSGAPADDPVGITLAEDTYFSPYLGVELWDDAPEPALVLEGTLDDVPIRFLFNSGEVFEAESERLEVGPETYPVTFALQPTLWFADIDGTTLMVGADGVAEISSSSNTAAFDLVEERLDQTTDGTFPGGSNEDDNEPND